ncbi:MULTISPECIES: hypothetical protein [unclassified Moorena]|nr:MULTISPECIES: hypothetical protein [unclassified Moorena]NEO13785.1 hypothetical protein [Moorena sp. SIO3E8]NEQ01342.1 hypothetical protein [Moorena sp. SIO3F7]
MASSNPYNYVQGQAKTPCIFQVRPVANLIRQRKEHRLSNISAERTTQ